MRRIGFIAVLLGIALARPGGSLLAESSPDHDHCECVQTTSTPPTALAQPSAVFAGTAVERLRPNDRPAYVDWVNQLPNVHLRGYAVWRTSFAVSESWKGAETTTVTVRTRPGVDCGFKFDVGSQYLVYAYPSRDGWETNVCTRTGEITTAANDLAYLQTQPQLALGWPLWQPVLCGSAALGLGAGLAFGLRWLRREATLFER